MSGVRTGSRLQQLERLAARIQYEIAVEHARLHLSDNNGCTSHEKPATTSTGRLEQLGVTSLEVKHWAVTVGLLHHVARGRIALSIVEAYATARGKT